MSDKSEANIARLVNTEEVVSSVVKEIQGSEKVLAPWKARIVKYFELYRLVQSKKHYEGLSNIFVPEILRAVETIVGKLYQIVVGENPFFEYRGRDDTDEGAALAHTQLVMYQMDENGFRSRLMDSLRQMVIAGITVRKVLWDYQEVSRKRKLMQTEKQVDGITGAENEIKSPTVQDYPETVRDHWTMEPVDLLGFHISDVTVPYNDIQKARWIAEQFMVDRQWIKERAKKGWLASSQIAVLDQNTGGNAVSSDATQLRDRRSSSSGFNQADENNRKIEIIERWGLVPATWVHSPEELAALQLDPDDMVEAVVIIANRKAILKLEANPFYHQQKPYVSCPYVAQEFQFDGIGVAQIGEKLQEELNDTRNQTMDNKTLNLMTMWLKSRTSGIKNSDLRVRPLGVITTNDMKGLEPLRPPVLAGVGVNIEGVIKEDLRQSVGAASNLQGIAQAGVDTATESSLINKESFGRLLLTAELYGELVIKPVLIFAEFLNQQFYDHTKVIKIIGAGGIKFRKMAPEEIVGYKDVVIKLATDVDDNPGVKRQQLLQFLTIVQQMPPEMVAYHWKILDKIYKSFFSNGRSLDEIYEAPPQAVELLTPEEEIELIIAEYPAKAQKGQNHMAHVQFLEAEYNNMKFGLSQVSLQLLQDLILQHYQLMEQELMESQALEQMQAGANGPGSEKMNTGQAKNMSAFTQTKKPSSSSDRQNLGR